MKTLVEIINFIEYLKKEYKEERKATHWLVQIKIGYRHQEITFYIDNIIDTLKIKAKIKAELGEPTVISFRRKELENKPYTVYIYDLKEQE